MTDFNPADKLNIVGKIVNEIVDADFVNRCRRELQIDEIYMKTIQIMLREAAADRQASIEEMWNRVAKRFGYDHMYAVNAAGFSLGLNYGGNALELRKATNK